MSAEKAECVKVVVRCRPLSNKEIQDQRIVTLKINPNRGEIIMINPKQDPGEREKLFTFDKVYDMNSKQETIYQEVAFPIIESILEGFNGTIFAYGQTGTGKTFSMEGNPTPTDKGVIPRAFEHIFKSIDATSKQTQFLVRASFLELYNEEIRDLLQKSNKKLEIRERPDIGVFVKDLSCFMVQDVNELQQKLNSGKENRHTGETLMNRDSSRSHSIFSVIVEMCDTVDGQQRIRVGKLNLVDLAGSERQSKTHAVGDRFKEAININQSLTTLGNVISALVDPKVQHIPYRDSKLTRLLQDSLGGNTKTVMIANIGPAEYNFEESMSTLRYANRAKSIKNKPHINEDPKDAMLRQFQEEIDKLKEQLANSVDDPDGAIAALMNAQVVEKKKIIKVSDEKKIQEIKDKIAREKQESIQKYEHERKKIEEQKNLAEKERMKLLKTLEEKENQEKIAQQKQEKLLSKIKKMEDKVIKGSQQVEAALQQERKLNKARQELEEQKNKEIQLESELQENIEKTVMFEKEYKNQQEECQDKNKNLKMLWNKLKQIENENKEIEEFYSTEIDMLVQRKRELLQDIKRKNLIVEYFIPEKELERLEVRAVYNQELDQWVYPNLHLAGNILRKQEIQQKDKRDKAYNKPDYLNLNNDVEEINVTNLEAHPNMYFVYSEEGPIREEEVVPQDKKDAQNKANRKASAKKRPTSRTETQTKKETKQRKGGDNEELFPQAKGLVSKKK